MTVDSRIYWRCRRGMRELEELLLQFVDTQYAGLPQQEKHIFIRLLDYSDPLLYQYVLGQVVPRDRELAQILDKIRHGFNA